MSRKFNALDPLTDAQARNDSYLIAQADPVNGIAKRMTVAQAKEVYGVKRELYTATGTEGDTITIPALAGRQLLFIARESAVIHEVSSTPDSASYTWDDADIVLGTVTNPGERFIILHRTY